MSRTFLLASRPKGEPTLQNFKLVASEKPVPREGELLLKSLWISVDPYVRGRMNEGPSYVEPLQVGSPFVSGGVAEVLESRNAKFPVGTVVVGMMLPWSELFISNGEGIEAINPSDAPLNYFLGALGMPGQTAYFGIEILNLKAGETLVVSGGAGCVGSIAGQLAKQKGVRVVGVAGTPAKLRYMIEVLGYDAAFNYHSANIPQELAKVAPKGIDAYYDNTGGPVSDAVYNHLNVGARIALCGQIAYYNEASHPMGPRIEPILFCKRATLKGFLVFDYERRYAEARNFLLKLYKDKHLIVQDTIVQGFEGIPDAFLGLFSGKNTGKMVVKIADPSPLAIASKPHH